MITIYSKSVADGGQALRFHNPHEDNPMLVKPKRETSPEDAAKLAHSSNLNSKKRGDFFVDTTPGQLQHLPDWVRSDSMFDWALEHGWIVEVQPKSKPMQQEAEAKRKLEARQRKAEEEREKAAADGEGQAAADPTAEEAEADAALQAEAPPGARRVHVAGNKKQRRKQQQAQQGEQQA